MNFLILLLCGSPILCICQAVVSKKYFGDYPAQNHFSPRFESDFFYGFPKKGQNAESVSRLTTSLLHEVYLRAGKGFNIVLSPVSIWGILAMLLEGAAGKTETELKAKLRLFYSTHGEKKYSLRNSYKDLLNFNQVTDSPTEFSTLNFIISDKAKMINREYTNIISQYYNGRHFETDGRNIEQFSQMINAWAGQASKNKIRSLITPALLSNLLLVIGNAVYFKSKWKYPFDPSQTVSMPFKDEYNRPIKNVSMMNQFAVLPYAYNAWIESEIVEIPYADDTISMMVILPREGVNLGTVLSKMTNLELGQIIPNNFTEETIQLALPRFHIVSKMYLNDVLKKDLGSVFSPQYAEFPHVGNNVYVSKISHRAEIENTEEGTTASAFSSIQFAYKSSGTVFRVNRPFIYLITNMKKRTVLFAGTYTNPFIG